MRAFLEAFLGLFSPSWDGKQFRVLKMPERSAFLVVGEGVVRKSVKVVKAKNAKSL